MVCGPPPDVNWNSISSAPSSIWQAMAGGDFAQGALGKDLDRYQPLVEPPVRQEQVSKLPTPLVLVVVHSGDGEGAHKLKPEPGWQQCIHGRLNGLDSIWDQLKQLEGNPLVCFCHHSDQLAPPAAQVVAAAGLRHADAGLISSDESLQWSTQRSQPPGNPQFRMAVTSGGC